MKITLGGTALRQAFKAVAAAAAAAAVVTGVQSELTSRTVS